LFATDEVTVAVTRDDLLTSDNWFAFVAKHVDEILRKWYLNGLYGLPEDNGEMTAKVPKNILNYDNVNNFTALLRWRTYSSLAGLCLL